MRLLRKLLKITLLSSLWLLPLGARLEAGEATQQVELRIGSILASNQSNDFDPKLAKLKKDLQKFNYRSFRLIKEDSKRVPWQTETTFEIPGGRSLVVTPQERRNNQLSLKVRLLGGEKPVTDTTVSLREGDNLLLAGEAYEGGVLMVLISASTK